MSSKPVVMDLLMYDDLPCEICPPGGDIYFLGDILIAVYIDALERRVYCRIKSLSGLDYHGLLLAKNLCDLTTSKRLGKGFHGHYKVLGVRIAGEHPRLARLISSTSEEEPLTFQKLEDELQGIYGTPGIIEWPGLGGLTKEGLGYLLSRPLKEIVFDGWEDSEKRS